MLAQWVVVETLSAPRMIIMSPGRMSVDPCVWVCAFTCQSESCDTGFVHGAQWAVEEAMGAHGMINYVDARTSWMDGVVARAVADCIKQVVIIAAGYCTRAYRLHQPGVKAWAQAALAC